MKNLNRKRQIHFVANSMYEILACDYEVNVVQAMKIYFAKNTSILRNKYNLDVNAIQDVTHKRQRQLIEKNMSFLSYRNLIYKMI